MVLTAAFIAELDGRSIDPTDPRNFVTARVDNDLSTAMYIRQCAAASCSKFAAGSTVQSLRSGAQTYLKLPKQSSDQVTVAISDDPSRFFAERCLTLGEGASTSARGVQLSSASSCS